MAVEIKSYSMQTIPEVDRRIVSASKGNAGSEVEKNTASNAEISSENLGDSIGRVINESEKPVIVTRLEISRESLQEAVGKLQDFVDEYQKDLTFSIDDDTGRTVVRLLDSDNNVVKQYPTEEVLNLIQNLKQNKGLIIGQA